MSSRVSIIFAAQWKSLLHIRRLGARGGRILAAFLWVFWYGLWAFLGLAAAAYTATASQVSLETAVPLIFMGTCLFWQLAPIVTAEAGASLDIRKILIYPISDGDLFSVELLLRLSTALEVILVLAGTLVGLLLNPAVPLWFPAPALLILIAFNLFLSAGLRSLLERLLAMRHVREIVVLVIVLCAALPQLLVYTGGSGSLRRLLSMHQSVVLPWAAAARFALGGSLALPLLVLCAWTGAAYVFGRTQFRRSLRFDVTAARSAGSAGTARWAERLYHWPAALFPDPLAALVEKELRTLARAPRFRVVFLMGFSFGVIIWWPLLHGGGFSGPGGLSYPVVVSGYAMILLAEVAFWNQFGFDRSAAQLYFCAPVPFSLVLRAKNVAGMTFVFLEIGLILAVCAALRVPLPLSSIAQAVAVTLVLSLFFLSVGNVSSIYQPRAANPEHSWGRSSAGRFQVYMLLLFPVIVAPIALAYLAGFAFDSHTAFYAVLGFDAVVGAICYHIATSSAVAAAHKRREEFLGALGQSAGPFVTE
jgi:ABC-2 type transport system permease protein